MFQLGLQGKLFTLQTIVYGEEIMRCVNADKEKRNERDIVQGKFPYASKCIVIWDNKRCGSYLKPVDGIGKAAYDPYYKMNSVKLEIIGNKFDVEVESEN